MLSLQGEQVTGGQQCVEFGGEGVRVGMSEHRLLIEIGEVRHLVANGPALRRGRCIPRFLIALDEDCSEGFVLGAEVGADRTHRVDS